MEPTPPRLQCVAAVAALQSVGNNTTSSRASKQQRHDFFKSAQWSADGTTILTNSEDNILSTFVLPPDLLDPHASLPHQLRPYATFQAPEPVYETSLYPYFNLQDPSTTLFLSSPRSHPIALRSCLNPSHLLTSYRLIHEPTETYITPHSLLWTTKTRSRGPHFVTGSDSLISLFDISRDGEGPVSRFPTIPSKRKKIVGGGVGMKGIVSALGISPEGILAAGTFTRYVGLYDQEGSGECIAVFSLSDDILNDVKNGLSGRGAGVTQVLWSPCGRYLYVAERKSNRILAYDVRVTGRRLASLVGRRAGTNQRLGVDIVQVSAGSHHGESGGSSSSTHEIWAGGMDGVVRVWRGPPREEEEEEGDVAPTWEWKVHDDPITSTILHPASSVSIPVGGPSDAESEQGREPPKRMLLFATCAGQRERTGEGENGERDEHETRLEISNCGRGNGEASSSSVEDADRLQTSDHETGTEHVTGGDDNDHISLSLSSSSSSSLIARQANAGVEGTPDDAGGGGGGTLLSIFYVPS